MVPIVSDICFRRDTIAGFRHRVRPGIHRPDPRASGGAFRAPQRAVQRLLPARPSRPRR